jgi:NADPH:quinone reductase
MKAIVVAAPGGPEVLQYGDLPEPKAGEGEVLVRIEAIGVNFLDVYHRTGLYPLRLPFTPGSEAAGVVEALGSGVEGVSVGDRVAYSNIGAYAELAAVPAEKLVPLPHGIDARTAAAVLLQGITAHYLTTSTFPLDPGDSALVHAAAGGVGGLLVQLCAKKGARVLATASTGKLEIARDLGADVVIDYTSVDFQAEVMQRTEGRGVDVVYDSVGRSTFDGSLASLRSRGMLVMFGQSSGPVPPLDILRLSKRSLFLTRPTLAAHMATRQELLWRTDELFEAVGAGLRVRIDRELPLEAAGEAHRLLEDRQTAGKLILIP